MGPGASEWMAVALARTIRDGEVVAQGVNSVLASLGILLARATHAPSLTWITIAGDIDPVVTPLGVLGPQDGRLVLQARFPGVAVDAVKARTGFPVLPEGPVPVLEPTEEELRILRDLDPGRQRDLEFPRAAG